jgi:hypothetical protein
MSFLVGALPHSGWQQAVPLLEEFGWESQQVKHIEHWVEVDNGETPVLIIHRRPEYLVAGAIASGMTPSAACDEWRYQASRFLSWLKYNRRRACLVETDALLSADSNLIDLGKRLGIANIESKSLSAAIPDLDPLHLLFALQAIRQTEGCEALIAELDASTLPVLEKSFAEPVIVLDEVVRKLQSEYDSGQAEIDSARVLLEQKDLQSQEFERQLYELRKSSHEKTQIYEEKLQRSLKDNSELGRQLQASKEESILLLEQLHLVQEELETVLIREKQQGEEFQRDIQVQEAGLAKVQTELVKLRRENEALLADYNKATESTQALERLSRQLKKRIEGAEVDLKQQTESAHKLEEQRCQFQKQLETSQAELAKLHEKQAAFQKAEKDTQREKQLLHDENNLLLEQLHLVQIEIEHRLHSCQQMTSQLNESDAALSVANAEITKLQNELNEIKGSQLYKLIKPALPSPLVNNGGNKRKLRRNIRVLKASALFDSEWYLMTYGDVAREKMDPIAHYIKFGAAEGRDPSIHFNTSWYLRVNLDVAESGINPLIHYIKYGKAEGRAPKPEKQSYLPGPRG